MKLLALDTRLYPLLRTPVQWLLGALPVVCMFAPYLPLIQVARWLDSPAGAAHNPLANGSSYALAWIVLFVVGMIGSMLVGYGIGWLLNMAVSRLVLRWPWGRVKAIYLHAELPAHWFRDGVRSLAEADDKARQDWEAVRRQGALRFILKRGVLAWGVPMFLVMHVLPSIAKGSPPSLWALAANVAIWAVAGAGFGATMWWWSEAQHRKRATR